MPIHQRVVGWVMLISGLSLGILAAAISVNGLRHLFVGAGGFILALGTCLELCKGTAASGLHLFWPAWSPLLRSYLLAAVVVLSGITTLGLFSQLTTAYDATRQLQEQSVAAFNAVAARIDRLSEQQADILARRDQLDSAINVLLTYDRASKATALQREQRDERALIASQLATINLNLESLHAKKTDLKRAQLSANAKHATLVHLGNLLGIEDSDRTARLFALILISVTDPVALILLVAGLGFLRGGTAHPETVGSISADKTAVDCVDDQKGPFPNRGEAQHPRASTPPEFECADGARPTSETDVSEGLSGFESWSKMDLPETHDVVPISSTEPSVELPDSLITRLIAELSASPDVVEGAGGERLLQRPHKAISAWLSAHAPEYKHCAKQLVHIIDVDGKPPRSFTADKRKIRAICLPHNRGAYLSEVGKTTAN